MRSFQKCLLQVAKLISKLGIVYKNVYISLSLLMFYEHLPYKAIDDQTKKVKSSSSDFVNSLRQLLEFTFSICTEVDI